MATIELWCLKSSLVLHYVSEMSICHPGNSKADETYQNALDQIEEILNSYPKSHAVILLGDFNASLKQRKGNNQDLRLPSFVDRNSLVYKQNGQ